MLSVTITTVCVSSSVLMDARAAEPVLRVTHDDDDEEECDAAVCVSTEDL